MKASFLSLTLTALFGAGLAFGAANLTQDTPKQDAPATKAPEKTADKAPAEQDSEGKVGELPDKVRNTPKRLGGDRLNGTKVKPKAKPVTLPPAPQPVGPPVAGLGDHGEDHTGHDHGSTPAVTNDQAPPGRGGITFAPNSQTHDFGDLIQGDTRSTVFKAKSNGPEPLVISSVNKSCGCTLADIRIIGPDGVRQPYMLNQPIQSGTEIEILADIDTTGKSHQFRSDITLMTNDPRKGIVFSLMAKVKEALTANPRTLNMAQMKSTETRKGQVVIQSDAYGAFGLKLDPNIPLKNCKVELVPVEPNEKGQSERWVVQVELGPNMAEGQFYQSLRLISDMQKPQTMPDGTPMTHDLIVFVTASVMGPVSVNPPHLSYGILRPDQPAVRKATIMLTDDAWEMPANPKLVFKGYGEEFGYADNFKASIAHVEGTRTWELTLDCLGMEQVGSGAFRGLIEVHLGHPAKPVLEVGFSGAVRAGVVKTPGSL